MRSYFYILASALLLAALTTEIALRYAMEARLPFIVATFLALVVMGLFNVRVAERFASPVNANRRAPRKRSASVRDDVREQGVVKWFDKSRGYGFIIRDNGGEIFVHLRGVRTHSNNQTGLKQGDRVSYVVDENEKGYFARQVVCE